MGRPVLRSGRLLTILLAGLAIVAGVSLRPSHPFSNAALAAKAEDDPETLDGFNLTALQQKFQTVADRVAPAVVSISAAETASDSESTLRAKEMNPQKLQELLDKTTRTIGTGFIVESDGFILTNEHVIEDSQQYWVTTDDRRVYPAIVVGADPRADLAVLKIPAVNLPTVRFANDPCQRGQWAITLGNPYGLAIEGEMALSVGVISATRRSLPKLASKEDRLYSDLIQTTAQINPGNSGGPLLDVSGQVIGIDTAVILPQKQTNGIGFAIPITAELLNEVRQLEQGREVVYAYVGVTVTAPTPAERQQSGLSGDCGVWVESIEPGSPAAEPGAVQNGDIIVQLNGLAVPDTDRFVRMVGAAPVNRSASFTVMRNGKLLLVHVTPIKRPVQFAVTNENQRLYWRGMVLGPVPTNWTAAVSNATNAAGILVVGIQDDSPLKKQGIGAGAVITAIAGQPVKSLLELQKVLNDFPPQKCDVQLADQVLVAKK